MSDHYYKDKTFVRTYHDLVSREDYQNNLLGTLGEITPLEGMDVLELGAGTGRVTHLIAPFAHTLVATDISYPMLLLGKQFLSDLHQKNWHFTLADHGALPFKTNTIDLVISGWSFHSVALESQKDWKISLDDAFSRIAQILRPGGLIILIESLGTGVDQPNPPAELVSYLESLDTLGFKSKWIRTDYCFRDMKEAKGLTGFFWHDESLPFWETEKGIILPECTGLWWKFFES